MRTIKFFAAKATCGDYGRVCLFQASLSFFLEGAGLLIAIQYKLWGNRAVFLQLAACLFQLAFNPLLQPEAFALLLVLNALRYRGLTVAMVCSIANTQGDTWFVEHCSLRRRQRRLSEYSIGSEPEAASFQSAQDVGSFAGSSCPGDLSTDLAAEVPAA